MRIVIVTDVWRSEIYDENRGQAPIIDFVRIYEGTIDCLQQAGHQVSLITPLDFSPDLSPVSSDIPVGQSSGRSVSKYLYSFRPDAVHITTEGLIGHAARAWCLGQNFPFTTSFHSPFPDYIRLRMPIPHHLTYDNLRNFHKFARRTLVLSPAEQALLQEWGYSNVVIWRNGVDTARFYPRPVKPDHPARPLYAYSGRVAMEKNIEEFLALELPGSKLVIGDGPDLQELRKKYPAVQFVGDKSGEEFAEWLAGADVLVCPGMTDGFGMEMVEAMACGIPVAAYPVAGPLDLIVNGVNGVMDADLRKAALMALELDAEDCVRFAHKYARDYSTQSFLSYLEPVNLHDRGFLQERIYADG
ncbi:MAG: glycosyltransferase [Gammaproteobacteria bacterium]